MGVDATARCISPEEKAMSIPIPRGRGENARLGRGLGELLLVLDWLASG